MLAVEMQPSRFHPDICTSLVKKDRFTLKEPLWFPLSCREDYIRL